ncbi:hypothetical protein Tco_1511889, partial [Tanacetum coccineum]
DLGLIPEEESRVKMKMTQEMRHLLAAALQSGQLKKPDHADLQNKCMIYAHLLQLLKILNDAILSLNLLSTVCLIEVADFLEEI